MASEPFIEEYKCFNSQMETRIICLKCVVRPLGRGIRLRWQHRNEFDGSKRRAALL